MEDSQQKQRLLGLNSSGSLKQYYTSLSESARMPEEPSPEEKKPNYPSCCAQIRSRYRSTDKFIRSKAAILIMILVFLLGFLFWGDHLYTAITIQTLDLRYHPIVYALGGLPLCFYPLAGMLADNKYGRYRTIVASLCILLVTASICSVTSAVLVPLFHIWKTNEYYSFILSCTFYLLASPGSIGFFANHMPFGLDQLYEAPGDHQSLFIHWLIWINQVAILINSTSWYLYLIHPTHRIGIGTRVGLPRIITILTAACLIILIKKSDWFLRDSAHLSPYKLVYEVRKFSKKHKFPLKRSAFTYNGEELPKGLDLGKEKYGGPFSTEQVEDVKAFFGILKILFCVGPFFFVDISTSGQLNAFSRHISPNQTHSNTIPDYLEEYLIRHGILKPLLIVVCLPVYIVLLRPFLLRYQLGMVKRFGLAIVLKLLSLLLTLAMDEYYHIVTGNPDCMFDAEINKDDYDNDLKYDYSHKLPFLDMKVLITQRVLGALSYMLFQIAVFEFICSQSPRSMVGMLVGLGFAIRGINNIAGSILLIPFIFLNGQLGKYCNAVYFSINFIVGVLALISLAHFGRKYQNRKRNDFCDYHRYAENYFSHHPKKSLPSGLTKKNKKNESRTKWYSFIFNL